MLPNKLIEVKQNCKFFVDTLWKWVIISGVVFYLIFIAFIRNPNSAASKSLGDLQTDDSPTNIHHLVFGLIGSENAWHKRQAYTQSWWRPKVTRGYLFLDKPPTGDLLPWSKASPPYRVSNNISKLITKIHPNNPIMTRMVHGIMEVFREEHGDFRWLVMGDDDSILFLDNIVDLLAEYDHTKYYYFGGQSENIMSNYWFSFNQGFGGAGFILSYPLAKALANDMDDCLTRYAHISSADKITMLCIADIGVNLSPHKGIHQIDLHGDISGFLSSHPHTPLISLHHLDMVEPIFPSKNRYTSARHLMKASNLDHSRILQQTICHKKQSNWSFSISWGYSVHVYEQIMPRSMLQLPIETFLPWSNIPDQPPRFMFNTRVLSSNNSCEAPHVFYLDSIKKKNSENSILTVYKRASPRGLPACSSFHNQSADIIFKIEVLSPATKHIEDGRCECCDIIHGAGMKTARVKFRQCMTDEIIA